MNYLKRIPQLSTIITNMKQNVKLNFKRAKDRPVIGANPTFLDVQFDRACDRCSDPSIWGWWSTGVSQLFFVERSLVNVFIWVPSTGRV
ncbi:hypothetical protein BH23PAT2_BH23PAT2_10600 [soil metagenome]